MSNCSEVVEEQVNRLKFIDGLRGLAILLVVYYHAAIWGGVSHYFALRFGRAGVDLFLVLSGFCLFWPLIKQRDGKVKELATFQYLRKRTKRILPPYYVAIVLVICCSYLSYHFGGPSWWPQQQPFQHLFPWTHPHTTADLATHLLLIHGFFNSFTTSFDGAFWSLSLEWQFYFLFLLLAWIGKRWGILPAILVPIVVALLFRLTARALNPGYFQMAAGDECSIGRWAEFGAGMIAATVACHLNTTWASKLKIFSNFKYMLFSVAIALLVEWIKPAFFLIPFLWGNAGCAIISYASQHKNHLHKFLEWKPLVSIGTISYSLYLTHGSIYMLMSILLSTSNVPFLARVLIFMVFGPPLALGFSTLFFTLFEKPYLTGQVKKREEKRFVITPKATLQDQAAP